MIEETIKESRLSERGRFKGKVAFVAGAGSGIGLAAAEALAAEGARVLLAGRSANVEEANARLQSSGLESDFFIGDMADENNVAEAFRQCRQRLGGLDVLINAAGICRPGLLETIGLDEWDEMMRNNLTNTFLCCREAIRIMKVSRRGAIVNVSSLAGRFRSGLGGAHYAASKAAVIGLTRHVSAEAATYGIRVNAVCPGPTETKMLQAGMEATKKNAEMINRMVPLGYISSPQDQAGVILFLASDESRYMTGSILDVNGGIYS